MLSDMATSGCGRCLKLIHSGVGTSICVFFRVCLPSLGLSPLQFPRFSSNLIHTERHCRCPSASSGAHLRQSPFRRAPGWLSLSHVDPSLLSLLSDQVATLYSQPCLCRVLAPASDAPQTSGDIGQVVNGLLEVPSTRLEVKRRTPLAENTSCPPIFVHCFPQCKHGSLE